MICKSCGSENEAGALSCAKCGHELTGESGSKAEAPKVKTYIVRNIILLTLSLPFFWIIVRTLIDLQTFYHGSLIVVKAGTPLLLFFVGGILLARRIAGRVKAAAEAGDYEQAKKIGRRYTTLFFCSFVLNIVMALYVFIAIATTLAYKERSLESAASSKLRELGALQNKIYEEKGAFASRLEDVEGWEGAWEGAEGIEVKILSVDEKCWKGSALHKKVRRVVIYDHCSAEKLTRVPR